MQATMQRAMLYALNGSVRLKKCYASKNPDGVVGTLSGICIAPAQTIMGRLSLSEAGRTFRRGTTKQQQLRPATKPPLPKPFECNPGSSDKHLNSFHHFPGRSC